MSVRQDASTGQIVGALDEPITELQGRPVARIKVYSPFQTYFDGPAFSISAVNATGPFDILPRHHNFISLLEPCDLLIASPQGELRVRISGGLMHVKADAVTVFLDV